MTNQSTAHERQLLVEHMANNQLQPLQPVIVDNRRHTYPACINGKQREASYIAMRHPTGLLSPRLVCTYGLTDEPPEYTYLSKH